ncbi:NAC domain containing protein [Tylopilus felleus]|jgi:nascent polypeptide-associated complex subunit beta
MDPAKLAKLQAQAAANRLGGKGTMRRKVVRKTKPSAAQDDKKLQAALKKLNVQPITGVEEVNMFKEDGNVLHFTAPKVHAAVPANTFAIYGAGHVKELTELVPGILNQLGPDSLASLRKLAESYQAIQQGQQRPAAGAENDDDDVPDLVENFDVEGEQAAAVTAAHDKEKLDDVN